MKKHVILLIFLLLLKGGAIAQQHNLTVIVKNIKNTKGSVLVALSTDEKTFLKKFDYGKKLKAMLSEVEAVFEDLPPGEYGISVIHDENDNGKLDTNALGIPKEGFGFGNNSMGNFGPPPFEKAKIIWNGDSRAEIVELKYL